MNILGIFSVVKSFFSSKGGETVVKAADSLVYTKQEQAQDSDADLASARAFQPAPPSPYDSLIDKWHRAIRPLVATWVLLVLMGILPPPAHFYDIPAPMWQIILVVISFYFGGRALLKDVPDAVSRIREVVRRSK